MTTPSGRRVSTRLLAKKGGRCLGVVVDLMVWYAAAAGFQGLEQPVVYADSRWASGRRRHASLQSFAELGEWHGQCFGDLDGGGAADTVAEGDSGAVVIERTESH